MAIDVDEATREAELARVEADPGVGPLPEGDGAAEAAAATERPSPRVAVGAAFSVLGCAVMVGGIFSGASPRLYAGVAGVMGVGLAYGASRLRGRPLVTHALIAGGLFGIGLVMLFPYVGDMLHVTERIREATKASSVLRPPVDFDPGWKAVVGWLMGIVGFTAAWVALEIGWRSASLLLPVPVAAVAAVSVPEVAQVASGVVVLVLFAMGLGIVASESAGGDDEQRVSLGYELRKAAKAVPLLAAITAALVALSTTDFLFPDPVFDPAQEPQRPKTQPLSEVEDRVLFEVVDTDLTGPFRMGSLDVYVSGDGSWRLPPFAASELEEVPKSGIVDPELQARQELHATFRILGLGGSVLPSLPNSVGIAARGPRLAWDERSGNLRVVNGAADAGFTYTVTAAGLPREDALKAVTLSAIPKEMGEFRRIPAPPPAVRGLLDQAPTSSPWERFNWLRKWILDHVTAKGTGRPVDMPVERVAELISGDRKGSPFEIVAAQAMLARWVGLPSRIGYGFDGGERVGDALQVRPRNGATWVEVWFPGYKWLPVIGTPRRAEPTVGGDPNKVVDPSVLPSNEISPFVYLPVVVPPKSVLAKRIGVAVLLAIPVAVVAGLGYTLWPLAVKGWRRARRRSAAVSLGVRARVAVAYAEWRDYATDLGYLYPSDTPLMFLERFADDDEHTELAWLTTRVLWGDLRENPPPEAAAAAEELSRSLRRRLASVQPATLRAVALVSRLSLRNPYLSDALLRDGELGILEVREHGEHHGERHAA